MADKVTLTIDGRKISAPAGATILDAATEANIYIPNLCSNKELLPYGSCRLCMVEIEVHKRTRLVASCIYEVAEGLVVKTDTERVLNVRTLVIELLLSRNPRNAKLLKIAKQLGVKETRFPVDVKGCILCGQCVRTCREVVGVSAIGMAGRGVSRRVAAPFNQPPKECIACAACVYVCPMQVIPMEEKDGVRTIGRGAYPMQKCEQCGRFFAPVRQLEYFQKIGKITAEQAKKCLHCR